MSRKKTLSLKTLRKIYQDVIMASEKTGEKLLRFQKKLGDLKITSKEAQGVVSNADIAAEKFLLKQLKDPIPEAEFLAEESAFEKFGGHWENYQLYKEIPYVWVIDPLDGTTNFLSNMDYYAVCVCLVHYGKPLLGVVHRPPLKQTYCALLGQGAFLLENRLDKRGCKRVRKTKLELSNASKKLKDSLLATGFACEKGQNFSEEFDLFLAMMKSCRGIRRMGSAALDICFVAQGIFDAFWERGLAPWDTAAASLIASESGAFLSDYEKRRFQPFLSTIVVGNKKIKREILEKINALSPK